jgi:hypothetical protein
MKKLTYLLLFVSVVVCFTNATAQLNEVSADLKKLNTQFTKRRYTYLVKYTLYDSYTSSKVIETQQMEVKMWDMMVNIKNKHFQGVKNKDHYVYINYDQKVMMLNAVNNYSADMKQLKELEKMIDLDTLLQNYKRVDALNLSEGLKGYRFHLESSETYAYSDIIINTRTGMLDKMVLYYAQTLTDLLGHTPQEQTKQNKPRMEILFNNFVVTPKLQPNYFSLQPYVAKAAKRYEPTETYKGYKFINNIN